MPTTNKHFVGNLPQLQLSAILLSSATVGGTFGTTGTVTGWPDGTGSRSFVVAIGTYGQTGYEEILCSLRGSNVFTIEQRGYDNTSIVQHASGDPVTLVVDAGTIDAHELYVFQNTRRDVLANRGSAATYVDTNFYATDVRVLYRSDGTNWQPIGMASGVYTTAQRDALAAAEVYAGRTIWNSTTVQMETYTGAAWAAVPTAATVLLKANNLSDLASATTARTNLGLAAIAASGSATDLSAGTVPTARLGSGAASSLTYLRGDQTWATPAGGTSSFSGVRVRNSTDQTVPTSTITALTFDTNVIISTGAYHSTSSNTSRLVAQTTGEHRISFDDGLLEASATVGHQRKIGVYVNGTNVTDLFGTPGRAVSDIIGVNGSITLNLTAGDYVEVKGYQDSGATMTYYGHASVNNWPVFEMVYLGA